MSTKKSRSRLRISDESDSERDDMQPLETPKSNSKPSEKGQKSTRSSERIHQKRNKEFHMPSREDVYKTIPVAKESPNKSSPRLKPRKLISDFTRITNRYNQVEDYECSSGSDSDFIDDGPVNEDSGSSEQSGSDKPAVRKRPKKGRVKRLRRISQLSDSSEETGDEAKPETIPDKNVESTERGPEADVCHLPTDTSPNGVASCSSDIKPQSTEETRDSRGHSDSSDSSDEQVQVKKQHRNVLDSDDASSNETGSQHSEHSGNSEASNGDPNVRKSKRARLMKKKKDNWRNKFQQFKKKKADKTPKS